jgi:hypothetical protein
VNQVPDKTYYNVCVMKTVSLTMFPRTSEISMKDAIAWRISAWDVPDLK